MEAAKQSQTTQPTPEQLLKLIDLQLAQERGKRAANSRNRATFLVVGILVIIVAAAISLFVAEQMAAELRNQSDAAATAGHVDGK